MTHARPCVKVNLSSGSSVMKGWWFTERCIDLASFRFEFVINSHGWREIIKKRLINETVMGRISTVHHSCLRTQLFWWTSTLSFDTEEWKEGITAGNWTLTAPSASWPWVMSYFMNCAEVKLWFTNCDASQNQWMRRLRKISCNFWSWNFENVINGCLLNVTLISRGSNRERWWTVTVSLIIQFYDIQNYTDVMVEFI